MMKLIPLLILFLLYGPPVVSQVYNPVNYNFNGTPTYGVKIKTSLPFCHGCQMPTLIFEGFNYGGAATIGIILNYYIYEGILYSASASSWGGHTPPIILANENNKMVIFIDHRGYYERFSVRAFAQGMSETPEWFQGWSVADEPLNASYQITVAYKNKFTGNVLMPGDGIWNGEGNMGIGTINPGSYKLNVNGTIRAKEVIVNTDGADFVFEPEYSLPELDEIEKYINENKHLPGFAPASKMKEDGISVSEMQTKLLQKMEELILYVIEQNKTIKNQNERIEELENKMKY